MACGTFNVEEVVDIVGVEHEGLFADYVGAEAQPVADKSIVSIVGCADGEIMERIIGLHLSRTETVEPLMLRKKETIRERAVKTAHTVKLVVGNHKLIARLGNSIDMAWSNVAGSSYEGKVFRWHDTMT